MNLALLGESMKARVVLFATLLILLLSPMASATSSGLTYVGASMSESSSQISNSLAISPDGNYLASGHNRAVVVYDADTMESVLEIDLPMDVYRLSFSHDSSLLAFVQTSGSNQYESVQKINLTTMSLMDGSVRSSQSPMVLAWSMDDKTIAVEDRDGGILFIDSQNMTEVKKMTKVHNTDLTCLQFSQDEQYLISGDESGRYAIWSGEGELVGDYREIPFSGGISDCGISPNSSHLYIVADSGEILISSVDGETISQSIITDAKQAKYSLDGEKIHVMTSGDSPKLHTLRSNTLSQETVTTFFHAAEDFAFLEDGFDRVSNIFVATRTGQIAAYSKDITPEGIGVAGSDIDGDLLPDDIDTDDDGDGIIDAIDINCESTLDCSQVADLSLIRSISVTVDTDTVKITDHYVFPSHVSANIRNLSRKSIGDDLQISNDEVDLFAKAACNNIDAESRIETWRSAISLSSGSLGEAIIGCKVVDGLLLWSINDHKSPVRLEVSVTYIIGTEIELPVTITIQNQPESGEGAISWLAPQHPTSINLNGEKGVGDNLELWHVFSGPVELTMTAKLVEEPTIIEVGASWLLHPLAISFYLFLSLIGVLFWLRHSNAIDIDIFENDLAEDADEEEFVDEEFQGTVDDYEVDYEEEYEEQSDWQEEVVDEPVRVRKKRVDSNDSNRDVVKKVKSVKKRTVKKSVTTTKRATKKQKVVKSEDEMMDDALDGIL